MLAFGVALTVLVILSALVLLRRKTDGAIEVGNVSPGWLAEFKLGKRETPWE
jgi:hypothetical protein